MIDKPKVVEIAAQPCALIHLVIPKPEIQTVMGPGIQELHATLAAQGVTPAGSWFTHHYKIVPDSWDFEICLPVAKEITASGRVSAGVWPTMRVVRAIYNGPYEGLGEAWGSFLEAIAARGHAVRNDLYERYLVGPESGRPSAEFRTELSKPLAE